MYNIRPFVAKTKNYTFAELKKSSVADVNKIMNMKTVFVKLV